MGGIVKYDDFLMDIWDELFKAETWKDWKRVADVRERIMQVIVNSVSPLNVLKRECYKKMMSYEKGSKENIKLYMFYQEKLKKSKGDDIEELLKEYNRVLMEIERG